MRGVNGQGKKIVTEMHSFGNGQAGGNTRKPEVLTVNWDSTHPGARLLPLGKDREFGAKGSPIRQTIDPPGQSIGRAARAIL